MNTVILCIRYYKYISQNELHACFLGTYMVHIVHIPAGIEETRRNRNRARCIGELPCARVDSVPQRMRCTFCARRDPRISEYGLDHRHRIGPVDSTRFSDPLTPVYPFFRTFLTLICALLLF